MSVRRRQLCKGLLPLGLAAGCESKTNPPAGGGGSDDGPGEALESVALPDAQQTGEVSIEAALAARRSIRSWTDAPVELATLGQLLWAAQGINRPDSGRRTCPSAGAKYPLELLVATADGIHHYVPDEHRLDLLSREDVRGRVPAQGFVLDAPVIVFVAAVFARTEERYGDRAARYVYIEAGHAAHGLMLQAAALGLGGTTVGAFDDAELQDLLGLPEDWEPVYVLPVGVPA